MCESCNSFRNLCNTNPGTTTDLCSREKILKMKKLIFIAIAVFFVSGYSFGQFTLGLRAGYNGNKLATDLSSIEAQFSNGFHMGLFSRIGKRIYVAPELLYTFSGGKFTNNGNDGTWNKQKFTLGSLDIPFL